ncbi:hypothetical protein Daus18300_004182 [Diaporthe australafricana]|uniref:Uncharacterized protein n=1 Tax=Diaporthe australafricana TaxID=127596 RepID=A0ABR3XAS3_9PEZI
MASADPSKASFRKDEGVRKASDSLYQTIVDSLEDLILITTEKTTWRRMVSKIEHRKKKTDADAVLQQLSEKTGDYECAIGMARDRVIERVGSAVQYTAYRTTVVHHDMNENHKKVHDRIYSLERKNSDLKATIKAESIRTVEEFAKLYEQNVRKVLTDADARARRQDQELVAQKNEMLSFIMESKRYKAELDTLVRREYSRRAKRGPVIAPEDFWQLFAEFMFDDDGPEDRCIPDDETSLNHPVVDLEYVLMYRGNMRARDSSQVQSLLRDDRFVAWMNQANPDLILANASLRSPELGKISPMSIFCADLVGCLATARPEDVIIHFFCGLHTDFEDEPFPGPAGLVRSLVLQVFLKLVGRGCLNLDFLHDRAMVEDLRNHDLEAMCYTLHELLHGFSAGTRVFCIIDSISMLDTFDTSQDLEVVLQCLGGIVDDRDLRGFFKVLMTNPSTCSMDMQTLPVFEQRPDRIVTLSSGGLMPGELSTQGIRRHISRSSSPSFSLADLERIGGRRRSHHDYEFDGA